MAIVTIAGLSGSGAQEIGALVAQHLSYDYVDRLILAEAARKIGTSVEVLANRTERPPTMGDRLASFMRTVVARSAMVSEASDPYYGAGADALLVSEYKDITEAGSVGGEEISDTRLLDVTRSVITELAESGNVVIIGRGSNIILEKWPGALHVGLNASLEFRINLVMRRQNIGRAEAEKNIHDSDRGREAYFRRFFHRRPHDPLAYHLMFNTDWLTFERASEIVVDAARRLDQRAKLGQ
jgi:cytidylate kinase